MFVVEYYQFATSLKKRLFIEPQHSRSLLYLNRKPKRNVRKNRRFSQLTASAPIHTKELKSMQLHARICLDLFTFVLLQYLSTLPPIFAGEIYSLFLLRSMFDSSCVNNKSNFRIFCFSILSMFTNSFARKKNKQTEPLSQYYAFAIYRTVPIPDFFSFIIISILTSSHLLCSRVLLI